MRAVDLPLRRLAWTGDFAARLADARPAAILPPATLADALEPFGEEREGDARAMPWTPNRLSKSSTAANRTRSIGNKAIIRALWSGIAREFMRREKDAQDQILARRISS